LKKKCPESPEIPQYAPTLKSRVPTTPRRRRRKIKKRSLLERHISIQAIVVGNEGRKGEDAKRQREKIRIG